MRTLVILIGILILYSCQIDKSISDENYITSEGIIPKEKLGDNLSVDTNTVYTIVEQMPRFKLCDYETTNEDELKKCSDEQLIYYITQRLEFPENPTIDMLESTTGVARFTVNTDGSISDVRMLREFIATESFLKAIKNMPKWERVGEYRGVKVKVSFTLPMKIQLAM